MVLYRSSSVRISAFLPPPFYSILTNHPEGGGSEGSEADIVSSLFLVLSLLSGVRGRCIAG